MTVQESAKTSSDILVDARALHDFVQRLWHKTGSSPSEAGLVADHLVMANLAFPQRGSTAYAVLPIFISPH